MMNELISKAITFACIAHIKQKRKYTNESYISHCRNVADIVSTVTDDPDMICAAWLHDTVEDTDTTIQDISKEFNFKIAMLVFYLTDISRSEDGNRTIRKAMDRFHISHGASEAKTIKLADLIDNSSSIVKYDPGFAKVYMQEKKLLLKESLKEGDEELYERACKIVSDYYFEQL